MIQKVIKILTSCALDTSDNYVISVEYFEELAKEIDEAYKGSPIDSHTDNSMFDLFWEEYHDKVSFEKASYKPKTNKKDARNHWKKLKVGQKEKAIEMIPAYAKSLGDTFPAKARTYLGERLFEDEYSVEKKVVITKKIATIE